MQLARAILPVFQNPSWVVKIRIYLEWQYSTLPNKNRVFSKNEGTYLRMLASQFFYLSPRCWSFDPISGNFFPKHPPMLISIFK